MPTQRVRASGVGEVHHRWASEWTGAFSIGRSLRVLESVGESLPFDVSILAAMILAMTTEPCPCGTTSSFADCCEPIITEQELAQTPEQLMRSRYSAYATGAVDWVIASNHPESREEIDREEILRWSHESTWQGLRIIESAPGDSDDEGFVRFRARYRLDGVNHVHKERAKFVREDGAWYFHTAMEDVDEGPQLVPVTAALSVGRNDPCPCGSGSKYKRCCA
jgi:SEC-C motif-containing protein